jgi:proteasome accessory factor C
VLDLESDARWVAEHYPYEDLEALGDGRLRITLTVTARPWLERLLLSLGPDATVVEVDDRLGGPGVRAAAASRVLRRYGIEGAMQ